MVVKKPRTARRGKGRPARDQPGSGANAVLAATVELLKMRSPDSVTRAELAWQAGIDPGWFATTSATSPPC